mgnify:CR=1 FL=1
MGSIADHAGAFSALPIPTPSATTNIDQIGASVAASGNSAMENSIWTICIAISLGAMYFIGLSLNVLTMMGLLLGVGMLLASAAAFAAGGASAYRATFSKGGACFDCHTITWAGDTVQMAPVKLTQRYMPRGAFDHSVPEHGGPGQSKAGGYKCADCHKAATSERTADVLIPDLAKCASCHGKTEVQTKAADDADCTTCHSFHAPGKATPPAGHPPLETLRWSQAVARKAAGD